MQKRTVQRAGLFWSSSGLRFDRFSISVVTSRNTPESDFDSFAIVTSFSALSWRLSLSLFVSQCYQHLMHRVTFSKTYLVLQAILCDFEMLESSALRNVENC